MPNDSNIPPNLLARLQMFMDLSQEYLELVPVMKSHQLYLVGDSENTRFHKRVITLHLSLVRKFINKDDQMFLGTINQQVYNELKAKLPRPIKKTFRQQQHEFAKLDHTLFIDESFQIVGADNQAIDQSQALYNLLYGRILHDDYGKWAKTLNWHSAYHQAANSLRNARDILWGIRSEIIYLQDHGYLEGLNYSPVIVEELWNGKGEYLGRREMNHYKLTLPE